MIIKVNQDYIHKTINNKLLEAIKPLNEILDMMDSEGDAGFDETVRNMLTLRSKIEFVKNQILSIET